MIPVLALTLVLPQVAWGKETEGRTTKMWVDPVTRYVHLRYPVPADAPEEVMVQCSWSPTGQNHWRPARVTPQVSETAMKLVPEEEWMQWVT